MVRDISIRNVEAEEELQEIEENIHGSTEGVPDISIDDLPRHYQRHAIGVLGHFGRLLCRVAHVVMWPRISLK